MRSGSSPAGWSLTVGLAVIRPTVSMGSFPQENPALSFSPSWRRRHLPPGGEHEARDARDLHPPDHHHGTGGRSGREADPGAKVYLASVEPGYRRVAESTAGEDGRYEFRDVPFTIKGPRQVRSKGAIRASSRSLGRPWDTASPGARAIASSHGPDRQISITASS